jgi:hypothetical protein
MMKMHQNLAYVHQNCGQCQIEQSAKTKDLSKIEKISGRHLTSTIDAGLERTITKTLFNRLCNVYDLTNALLCFILTGYSGSLSAAGHVGPCSKVDHDNTYFLEEM